MLILVHGNGLKLGSEIRNDIQEKIELALGRFERKIGKVNVYLADLNGPKKGLDKSIRLVVGIDGQPVIVVEEKGEGWQSLLDSLSDRAAHTVSRQLDRSCRRKGRASMAGDPVSNEQAISFDESDSSGQAGKPLGLRPSRYI